MRLGSGPGDREVDFFVLKRAQQARDEVARQVRRVAGRGCDQPMARLGECALQSRERTRKAGQRVGNDAVAKLRITIDVLIGVHEQFVDLRGKALDDPGDHRSAPKLLQTLVHAAHTAALTARQDHASDQC